MHSVTFLLCIFASMQSTISTFILCRAVNPGSKHCLSYVQSGCSLLELLCASADFVYLGSADWLWRLVFKRNAWEYYRLRLCSKPAAASRCTRVSHTHTCARTHTHPHTHMHTPSCVPKTKLETGKTKLWVTLMRRAGWILTGRTLTAVALPAVGSLAFQLSFFSGKRFKVYLCYSMQGQRPRLKSFNESQLRSKLPLFLFNHTGFK